MGNGPNFSGYLVFISLVLLGNLQNSVALPTFARELVCSMSIHPSGEYIDWYSQEQKDEYIRRGMYRIRNILPTRFQMHNKTVFLAIPRFRCGVPFSLATLSLNDYCKAEPLLQPFPSWEANECDDEGKLTNVVDLFVDLNQILWVLDIGIINTLAEPKYVQGPRILGFCTNTRKMKFSVNLASVVTPKSRLQFLQVETVHSKTYIYISDAGTNTLITWDVKETSGYRIKLPTDVLDTGMTREEDVLYIVLLRGQCSDSSKLHFTYLHSKRMFHINTHLLRIGKTDGVISEDGVKPGRIVILGSDNIMTLFFRLRGLADVFFWKSETAFIANHLFLAQRLSSLRLPSHVAPGAKNLIWTLESNFPDFLADKCNELGPNTKLHPTIKLCGDDMNITSLNCSSHWRDHLDKDQILPLI